MKEETTARAQLQEQFSLPALKQDARQTTNVTADSARGMYCDADSARSPENGSSVSHCGRCRGEFTANFVRLARLHHSRDSDDQTGKLRGETNSICPQNRGNPDTGVREDARWKRHDQVKTNTEVRHHRQGSPSLALGQADPIDVQPISRSVCRFPVARARLLVTSDKD